MMVRLPRNGLGLVPCRAGMGRDVGGVEYDVGSDGGDVAAAGGVGGGGGDGVGVGRWFSVRSLVRPSGAASQCTR